jgi:2-isopropylmalate synthase
VELGFKEIEIGFPSASQTEYDFARRLIERDLIPPDVTVQVLTQARRELIERTFEALRGVRRAVVHVYNSTSPVQREQVFRASREEIVSIAVNGARLLEEGAAKHPNAEWLFEYSPESFSGTEPEFAVEVCNAVLDVWQPQRGRKVILNLPATVEMTTPNMFADQVEYFCRNVKYREHVRVSLHTHNDRGCAVAAAELGLLAGADRIEGTLFGNGERTGNMDIVTMAMNLYSQGIDPHLNFADMARVIEIYKRCTDMPVHPRHPWAGDLVAYLPIDPRDLGRRYEEVVRINSQSGKGGVALVLERDHGITLPKWLHPAVSRVVQSHADASGEEVSSRQVLSLFQKEFLSIPEGWKLQGYDLHSESQRTHGRFRLANAGAEVVLTGDGQGLIEALIDAVNRRFGVAVTVAEFDEHAMAPGTEAKALASVTVEVGGKQASACCIDEDTSLASLQATLSAIGRVLAAKALRAAI